MRALLAALCLLSLVVPVHAQGVEVDAEEVLRYGDQVQYHDGQQSLQYHEGVGFTPLAATGAEELLAQVPPDDSDKWCVTVITQRGCQACEQLKQAFTVDPSLRALAKPENPQGSWAHLTMFDRNHPAQGWRGYVQTAQATPWIVVQPPRSGKYGPPTSTVWKGTYTGNPAGLYNSIWQSIEAWARNYAPPSYPAVTPYQPQPATPYVQPCPPGGPCPVPGVQPTPQPLVTPQPGVVPMPTVQPLAATTLPQIFIVVDPQGKFDEIKLAAVNKMAEYAQGYFGGQAKTVQVNFDEAVAMGLPVQREDTPAMFLVYGGKVRAFASGGAIADMMGDGVSATDLGIGGGFGALLLAVLTWFARRKKSVAVPTA